VLLPLTTHNRTPINPHPDPRSTKRALAEAEADLASRRDDLAAASADLDATASALRQSEDALAARRGELAGLSRRAAAAAAGAYGAGRQQLMEEGESPRPSFQSLFLLSACFASSTATRTACRSPCLFRCL
jgi:hypothetical protein